MRARTALSSAIMSGIVAHSLLEKPSRLPASNWNRNHLRNFRAKWWEIQRVERVWIRESSITLQTSCQILSSISWDSRRTPWLIKTRKTSLRNSERVRKMSNLGIRLRAICSKPYSKWKIASDLYKMSESNVDPSSGPSSWKSRFESRVQTSTLGSRVSSTRPISRTNPRFPARLRQSST